MGIANQIVKIAPQTKTMNSKIAPGQKKIYFEPCCIILLLCVRYFKIDEKQLLADCKYIIPKNGSIHSKV